MISERTTTQRLYIAYSHQPADDITSTLCQEATLPEPWLTTARVEGLDASLVALTALTRDGDAWQVVVSLAVAEVSTLLGALDYQSPGQAGSALTYNRVCMRSACLLCLAVSMAGKKACFVNDMTVLNRNVGHK